MISTRPSCPTGPLGPRFLGAAIRAVGGGRARLLAVSKQIPFVDYLALEPEPHLVANECTNCGARFFDRRNACAKCFGTGFAKADVSTEGELRSFTIVAFAAPGIPVPFVAGIIDCDGTSVRGNVINIEPDAEHVQLGMKVKLTTVPIGEDTAGTEAVNFAFEPLEGAA
jgi:uncharacterized protein